MKCWHCDCELKLDYQADDFALKFYYCENCDKWYQLSKEKERVNSAVPVKFLELNARPHIPLAI